ncbi:MAG: hypothetical protein H5T45_01575 [Thermoplasmatales archaeon]|nr:hypothetical protein [Thermoplasmatales archaeon]
MAALGKRIAAAFAYGIPLGLIFWILGSALQGVIGTLPSETGLACALVGLGCAIAIALAEDMHEKQ